MKRTFFTNGKVRKSVDEVINEIPKGMQRYAICMVDRYLRIFSNTDIEYNKLLNIIEDNRDKIVLWDVKTAWTTRAFSIHLSTN